MIDVGCDTGLPPLLQRRSVFADRPPTRRWGIGQTPLGHVRSQV
jgi:hypothetical protein